VADAHLPRPGLADLDVVELQHFGTALPVETDCLGHAFISRE
jgi:hypothetical protein